MLCLLSALSLYPWCVSHKYALISRFEWILGGSPCWMHVCIACVLCVACVAFVCVRCLAVLELVACLPPFFAFSLCLSCFCPFVLRWSGCLSLSSLLALFVLVSLWSLLLFLFPLRMNRQKERAQRFCPLCPLLSCCGLLYLVAALYSANSSGLNPLTS